MMTLTNPARPSTAPKGIRQKKLPGYRCKRVNGRAYAVVALNHRDVYLGDYDDPASRERYDRLVADWLASGRRDPQAQPVTAPISISELLLAYWKHAQQYYSRDGQPTKELGHIKGVNRAVRELYGSIPAVDFGPKRLKAVRQRFIDSGQCRRNVNANVQRVVRIFGWAVAEELVPAPTWQALRALKGLRYGHTEARESAGVKPVPQAHIDAVLPHVLPEVRAMIELQLASGMRSGELCSMRTRDVDTGGAVWCYRPARHKTQCHGHEREIWLGPKAQAILRPWFRMNLDEPIFSPRRARTAEFATCPNHQRRPRSKVRKSGRRLLDGYSVTAYHRAVTDGCDKAELATRGHVTPFTCTDCGRTFPRWFGLAVHAAKVHGRKLAKPAIDGERTVPRWFPHQLRHNAATEVRKAFGIEAAKAVLGQTTLTAALIYAEADRAAARNAAAKLG